MDVRFSSLRGEVVELAGGVTVVNDCYNANPMSMRAALEHLAASPAERRIAVLGTMAELGAGRRAATTARSASWPAELGIDVLITVGEEALGYAEGFGGETHSVATPEEAGALLEELARPGRPRAGEGLALGRPRASARVLGWARSSSAGMASLLICIFLGPRFIDYLREKEFGQHIREEGPEGHHGKAGTPTMGGLVMFLAVVGAVPDPERLPRREPGGVRHGARQRRRSASSTTGPSCASAARSASRRAPS